MISTHAETYQCVYGVVSGTSFDGLFFGSDRGESGDEFRLLYLGYYYYTDIEPGDCILVEGRVRYWGPFFFINPFAGGDNLVTYYPDRRSCN